MSPLRQLPLPPLKNPNGFTAISSLSNLSKSGNNGAFSVIDAGEGVVLTGSPGAIAGTPATPTLVGIVATGATASENNLAPGEFTILRTGDTTAALDVTYSIRGQSGDAVNGTDYNAINATTVTIAAGQSQVKIAIAPIDDAIVESTESIVLTLTDAAAYDVQANVATATVTIEDNDTALPNFNLQITEIWPGNSAGSNLTEDWFEITNTGTEAWVAGVTPDLYYDDSPPTPANATIISGLVQLDPNESAIVVVGTQADAQTFRTVWGSVINLTNVEVGYTAGAGLGANGDGVSLFVGLPATGAVPVDFEAYPTGSAGKSYDVNLAAFSAAGASGAVATAVNNGGQAAIGSPGNGNPITKISTIQGTGTAVIAGTYTIEGIVVGDFQGTNQLGGFYLQEEDTDADGNVLTSEAIFVNSLTAVNAGDKVRVTGVVAENSATPSFNQAIITPTDVSILTTGQQALVTATTVDLPTTVLGDLERYEGMLVTIPETLTITEVFNLGRFGEVSLSANGRLPNPTNIIDPNDSPASGTSSTGSSNVAAVTAQQDLNNRSRIILDDGSSASNLSDVPYIDTTDTSTLNDTLRVGSTIAGLTGVLGYGFNNYRIQATQAPIFNYEARPALPTVGGSVKVGSFNVLNYFNGDGLGGGFPTSRGADSAAEFSRQRTKIIAAIQALNADVVGLIEMENDGDGANSAIADLVNGLNAAMGAGTYAFVPLANTTGTSGTDEIKVAFIYKPSAVTPVGNAVYFNDSAFNTARPPLAQTFSVNASGEKFTSIVNHFKSKGSSAGLTGDADQGDGQGFSNATRKAQATALLNFVSQMQTVSGDSDVMILGDLNAYNEEDPIDILRAGGFTKLTTATESYVFDGQSGSLDHALVSASLLPQVTGAAKWNINSSEPIVFDYNDNIQTTGTNGEQTSELRNDTSLYSGNPFRSSDHDPVLVGLNLVPAKVTIAQSGGTTNVTEGGATDTYTVVLDRQPTANVTIAINAGTQLNTSSNSLTFTSANWNVAQTVTVTAIDDATFEGTHNGTIAHVATSTDASYNGLAIGSVTASITDNEVPIVTLKGFASLPADTFSEGPKSGAALTNPTNGRTTPFSGQPVQGFSGVQFAPGGDGSVFWFLADNGFGAKGNSADFLLRLYQLNPNFAGTENGDRSVAIQSFIQLSDPNKLVPFDIVNKASAKRELTGADFDVESFVIDAKGDIWVGDEFGTFVLHFDRNGVLLDAPFATPNPVKLNTLNGQAPIVIGHRGASGELPEHTIEAYRLAILRGADFIEPDLVSTKDGVLIARHEPILGGTTDVASRPEFASRKRSGVIDGVTYNNEFFASDFTLAEIKTLRAVMPQGYRDKIYDGVFEIPTFAEVIDLVKEVEAQTGKKIGIYPETKHPTYHDNLSLSLEEKLIDTLKVKNFTDPKRIFIQSFEVSNLKDLNTNVMPSRGVDIPLVQLLDAYDVNYTTGALIYQDEYARPYDFTVSGDTRTYGDLQTPAELAKIATYADGIGPWKRMIVSVKNVDKNNDGVADDLNNDGTINDADRVTLAPTSLVSDAHSKGLLVHPYTFRNESRFLASDYNNNPELEYRQFINLGVDGYFTDFPGTGDVVRDQITDTQVRSPQNPTVLSTPKFNTIDGKAPIVIGHRGASGDRPEHTLAAYKLAIASGADFIEPDLVVTKDGILIARHEPMLAVLNADGTINTTDTSTDVATRANFADRKKTKNLDGVNRTGWFAEDFTLAEIKTLNAIERIPALRGTDFDKDGLKVPTLKEVIDLVKQVELETGRKIGIYPETKHPVFFQQQGFNTSQLLVDTLKAENFTDPSRIFIQSFEVSNLKALKNSIMPTAGINIPLVQLFGGSGQPYDFVVSGDTRTYNDLSTTTGLAEIATYAKGIGPNKQRIIPQLTVDANNNGQPDDLNGDGAISDGDRVLGTPTTLIADAHKAGLIVHLYTLRNESFFLPSTYNGDPTAEYRKFIDLGVDGFFTDFPGTGRSVLVNDYLKGTGYANPNGNLNSPYFNVSTVSPVGFDANNPYYGDLVTANLGRSQGFEGMAFSPDRQTLYPLLEGTVVGDPVGSLRIYKFDVATKKYQGLVGRYQLGNATNAIGDFTPINNNEFLVIERDNNQGTAAAFKKIFKVDFSKIDANGFVSKEEVANLLNIKDTNDLNGDGSTTYTMPFQTIEDVLVLDSKTILVANDNNYPFSIGRPTAIDNNEIVVLELEKPLALDSRLGVAAAIAEAPSLKSGTAGVDNLFVSGGIDGINDTIFTGAGDDKVDTVLGVNSAFAGNNRVDLGSGNDSIFVNTGDRAFGGDGNDIFDAKDGKGGNRMSGGAGDDKFYLGFGDRALGGDGKDEFFVSSGGNNLLSGGAGVDIFNIITGGTIPSALNTILDFQAGTDFIGVLGKKADGTSFSLADLTRTGNSIAIGSSVIATLTGVDTSTLTASNFQFN
jgi:predicted extracellular nuclease/glycerophosphoryl diester phosphodiesterase